MLIKSVLLFSRERDSCFTFPGILPAFYIGYSYSGYLLLCNIPFQNLVKIIPKLKFPPLGIFFFINFCLALSHILLQSQLITEIPLISEFQQSHWKIRNWTLQFTYFKNRIISSIVQTCTDMRCKSMIYRYQSAYWLRSIFLSVSSLLELYGTEYREFILTTC